MRALKARMHIPVLALSHTSWRHSRSCCIAHRRQVLSKEMRSHWKLECTSHCTLSCPLLTSPLGTSVKSRTGSATSAKLPESGLSGLVFPFLAPQEDADINITSPAKPHRAHLLKKKMKMTQWIWMT